MGRGRQETCYFIGKNSGRSEYRGLSNWKKVSGFFFVFPLALSLWQYLSLFLHFSPCCNYAVLFAGSLMLPRLSAVELTSLDLLKYSYAGRAGAWTPLIDLLEDQKGGFVYLGHWVPLRGPDILPSIYPNTWYLCEKMFQVRTDTRWRKFTKPYEDHETITQLNFIPTKTR